MTAKFMDYFNYAIVVAENANGTKNESDSD